MFATRDDSYTYPLMCVVFTWPQGKEEVEESRNKGSDLPNVVTHPHVANIGKRYPPIDEQSVCIMGYFDLDRSPRSYDSMLEPTQPCAPATSARHATDPDHN